MNIRHRFHRLTIAAIAGAGLATLSPVMAQTVITNPSVSLTLADVNAVYTGEKQFAEGGKLVPVDNSAAQKAFLANVLRIDGGKYNSIWAKKSFREGLTAPLTKATDNEVIEFVKKTPGAVGYVSDVGKATGISVVK